MGVLSCRHSADEIPQSRGMSTLCLIEMASGIELNLIATWSANPGMRSWEDQCLKFKGNGFRMKNVQLGRRRFSLIKMQLMVRRSPPG
ncbi:hypothetical protein SESBI_42918 [Sesbania bispinosa]|nr:hypothetical protein SESBI_42918 [Sesbania bispinosa]